MAQFAVLNNNVVSNIIVADDKDATEKILRCVLIPLSEDNVADTNWIYDAATGKFNPPELLSAE